MKKKLISVIIALVLAVSMFATLAVASAEESELTVSGKVYVVEDSEGNLKSTALSAESNGNYYLNAEFGFVYKGVNEGVTVYYQTSEPASASEVVDPSKAYGGDKLVSEGSYYFVESDGTQNSKVVTVIIDRTAPSIDAVAFTSFVNSNDMLKNLFISAGEDFILPSLTSAEVTESVNDVSELSITLQYKKPSNDKEDDWSEIEGNTGVDLTTLGWWIFRYVLVDYAGNESEPSIEIARYIVDTSAPEVDTSDVTAKATVGSAYSIETPDIDDVSSYTSYYILQKKVDGEWKNIYYSNTEKIAESEESLYEDGVLNGYEDFVSAGNLTAGEGEEGNETYQVVFYVQDTFGNVAEPASYAIKVVEATSDDDDTTSAFATWKIVLIIIAALSAVGIVLLLVIKPKQEAPAGRIHYGKDDESSNN